MPNNDCIMRSDVIKTVEEWFEYEDYYDNPPLGKVLLNIPSADVEPVRHGRWVHKDGVYGAAYCSRCDFEILINNTPYCPHCGAKMDKEEEGG